MEEMLKKGVHFGYSASTLNPKMKPYIFTCRNNTEIFDLEKTLGHLNTAKDFLRTLGKEKKSVLFVGTKKEARKSVEAIAKELNMPYIVERWLGGILTNFKEIKGRIDFLNDLYQKKESGELEKYTKKERLEISKKIAKMNRYLEGIKKCQNLPACLIVIDSDFEKTAVDEAKKIKIPIVALINSDCNPDKINYPIPANDSSLSSIDYFLAELVKAYKEGLKEEAKETKENL
jgi:small subunit ribosomal protein S2